MDERICLVQMNKYNKRRNASLKKGTQIHMFYIVKRESYSDGSDFCGLNRFS